jgi:predicted nucleotidyltransferase
VKQAGQIEVDPSRAAQTYRERYQRRQAAFAELERVARSDVERIMPMIIEKYHPVRIYQWGSLTREGKFRDYSDIDIAVEGILDPAMFFSLLGDVQRMTRFPVDLVQLETIAPEYAGDIRRRGKMVYERA